MTPDHNKAAIKAAETLIKFGISIAPVSPLAIMEQMDSVIITTCSNMCTDPDATPFELSRLLGKYQGAMSSIHIKDGKTWYVVAYNDLLPKPMIQQALARELGHIILRHEESSPENSAEAVCFAHHLLCPRPLIHLARMTNMRITTDVVANLTGVFHQSLTNIRHTPGAIVPSSLNRFVGNQFIPFFMNFFDYYAAVIRDDGAAIADFGTYMDNYEE